MEKTNKLILVTGATGRQGGAVARHLLKDGWKVRALTRNPDQLGAKELRILGAEVVRGDLSKPSTLDNALTGVYGVFSVQNFWEHGADEEVRQGVALADRAKHAGVSHFVYSSVGGAERNSGIPHFESKWKIEEHIRSIGLRSTIVRPVSFMENLLVPSMRDAIYEGTLSMALNPDVSLQMVAVDDIGSFVAIIFDNVETYEGKAIEFAGDALTGPEVAEVFSNFIGRQVIFRRIPIDELRQFNPESAVMFEWFNTHGYRADIESLRRVVPDLQVFENWVASSGWHRAAA